MNIYLHCFFIFILECFTKDIFPVVNAINKSVVLQVHILQHSYKTYIISTF